MADEIYLNLREFLDHLPGGYPATVSGVEIKILKKLFSPEQAKAALGLVVRPEAASTIAQRLGMEENQANEILEVMAKEGLILRIRDASRVFYCAAQFLGGIYEFHLNTIDRELSELMEEYLPYLGEIWKSTKTKLFRIVPIGSSVDSGLTVSSYERIRELIKNMKLIAVAPCLCVKEQSLLENHCDRPLERCVLFNKTAEYYLENNMARQINEEELLALLKMGEKKALVLNLTNAQQIVNFCMCCKCCCAILRMLSNFPRPAEQVHAAFQARIDPERCIACGTCQERCQMGAVKEDDGVYAVNKDRCIGCGLCIPFCPADAMVFEPRPVIARPPKNIFEMRMRIVKEREMV